MSAIYGIFDGGAQGLYIPIGILIEIPLFGLLLGNLFKTEKTAHLATKEKMRMLKEKAERDQIIARTTQMLAHDIRKPFVMIRSIFDLLEVIDEKESLETFLNDGKTEIDIEIQRVTDMLEEIMELGKDGSLKIENINAKDFIEGVVADIGKYYKTNTAINVDIEQSLHIQVESRKFKRVFLNLIENAIEEIGENENITIKSKSKNNMVELEVHNTGSYIDSKLKEKLFQPFVTEGKATGTGLGLAIVDKIIRDHKGEIKVLSSKEEGTSFVISIPKR